MSTICKYCQEKDSIIEDYTSGEEVCVNCGAIYDENIIYDEIQKRRFEPETILKVRPKEKKQDFKLSPKIYRNFKRIQNVLSSTGISQRLIEKTKELYSKMAPYKNMQGKNFNHIIIALYYYASKVEGQAQTFKKLAKMFPTVNERQIRATFNNIKLYVVDNESDDE